MGLEKLDDFDTSYVGVRFVNEDDREMNQEVSDSLNVEKIGSRGFLVEGGALEGDGFYGVKKTLAEEEQETHNLLKNLDDEAEMGENSGDSHYLGSNESNSYQQNLA